MTVRRHPNVVHQDEVEPTEVARGAHRLTRRALGAAAGNRQLGASIYEVPPGARSYPRHWHGANEEAIYVLSGTGTARIGAAEVAIGAGDWLAFPVGPDHAHQSSTMAPRRWCTCASRPTTPARSSATPTRAS